MNRPALTSLDHLTSAFETLWEAKVYLLRTVEGVDAATQPKVHAVLQEVATARNHIEKLLIELQEKPPAAPALPPQ